MKAAKDHKNEKDRLKSLETYSVMDSLPEEDYDNLTRLAAQICGTPISLITLLDDKRQWFKSNHGLKVRETPKNQAFCAHAVNGNDGLFVIEDARNDERFHDNPLVTSDPNVIFYAGVPLMTREGLPLGTLCVIDHEPKVLDKAQVDALNVLSEQVMRLLELRKSKLELERANQELERRNAELEIFVDNAAHDLRSPLGNIWTFADVLQKGHGEMLDEKGRKILAMIKMSSEKLRRLIDGLLEHALSGGLEMEHREVVILEALRQEMEVLFSADDSVSIKLASNLEQVLVNKAAIDRILINLVSNAINYGDKESTEIKLAVSENNAFYTFSLTDNGPGIPKEFQDKVFEIFETLNKEDKFGRMGTGIGLATVKRTVEKLGGEIYLEPSQLRGSKFVFTVRK